MEIIAARKEKDGCGRRTTSRKSREDGEKRVIRTKGIRRAINHLATYSLQGRSPLRDTNIITTASFFFLSPLLFFFFLSRERERCTRFRTPISAPLVRDHAGSYPAGGWKKNGIDIVIGCRYYKFPFRTSQRTPVPTRAWIHTS